MPQQREEVVKEEKFLGTEKPPTGGTKGSLLSLRLRRQYTEGAQKAIYREISGTELWNSTSQSISSLQALAWSPEGEDKKLKKAAHKPPSSRGWI